jgi:sigma-B regulation protein RsbU (phosphoserine phosphatase)
VPQLPGWHFAVSYAQSPWPGGDYYDFLAAGDDRLALLMADASGHGGLAAVMMAQVRTLLHACPLTSGRSRGLFCPLSNVAAKPPALVLGHLNAVLEESSLDEQFMTAFYAVLEPASGRLHYAQAGQAPPYWWHASTATVEPLPDVGGPPLGMGLPASYAQGQVALQCGDVLVCASDGLIEAWNEQEMLFGASRLVAAIADAAPRDAEALKEHLLGQLAQFLAGAVPHDDVTLLIVQRLP